MLFRSCCSGCNDYAVMSEVVIQKFAFPFSCSSRPCQPEVTLTQSPSHSEATPTKSPARPTTPSTQSSSQEERLNHRSLLDPAQLCQPRAAGGLQNGTPDGSEPAPAEGGAPPPSSQVFQLVPRGARWVPVFLRSTCWCGRSASARGRGHNGSARPPGAGLGASVLPGVPVRPRMQDLKRVPESLACP